MSGQEQVPEEIRFSRNVGGLAEDVHGIVSKFHQQGYPIINPVLIEFASRLIEKLDKETLINGFIKFSHMHWGEIKKRKREFFLDHARGIFAGLPLNNIDAFKMLFELKKEDGSHLVCGDDEETLWLYFESLVKVSIKYIHRKRMPKSYKTERGVMFEYTRSDFFNDDNIKINLEEHAKIWEIHLDFPETA